MPDITDELRQMTDDAAHQARPLAVTEVIRRGNRRRKRSIAQRSLAGLSVAGLGAALILTGNVGGQNAPAAASGTAQAGGTTLTQTTTTPAGSLTVDVKYRAVSKTKIKLQSLTFTGSTKAAVKKARLIIEIGASSGVVRPPTSRVPGAVSQPVSYLIIAIHPNKAHGFSGSLTKKVLAAVDRKAGIEGNAQLTMTLHASSVGPGPVFPPGPVLALGTILSQLR